MEIVRLRASRGKTNEPVRLMLGNEDNAIKPIFIPNNRIFPHEPIMSP